VLDLKRRAGTACLPGSCPAFSLASSLGGWLNDDCSPQGLRSARQQMAGQPADGFRCGRVTLHNPAKACTGRPAAQSFLAGCSLQWPCLLQGPSGNACSQQCSLPRELRLGERSQRWHLLPTGSRYRLRPRAQLVPAPSSSLIVFLRYFLSLGLFALRALGLIKTHSSHRYVGSAGKIIATTHDHR
jgi:hypothetical protein